MSTLTEAIHSAISALKTLEVSSYDKSVYPDLFVELPVLIPQLECLLVEEQAVKRTRMDENSDVSSERDRSLNKNIRKFFTIREAYLKASNLLTMSARINPMNTILERLAAVIAEPEEPVLKILMPSLKVDYYVFAGENLKTLTEGPERQILHSRFIFTADYSAIIPLPFWFGMQGSGEEDAPFLFQMYACGPEGIYREEDQQRGVNPEYLPLQEEELEALRDSAGDYSKEMFRELDIRKNAVPVFFRDALEKMQKECNAHGVKAKMNNAAGKATEGAAHPDIYPKIKEFLEQGWWKLTEDQRARFAEFKNDYVALGDCIIYFRGTVGDVLTPEEDQRWRGKYIPFCVEVTAEEIQSIITRYVRNRLFCEFKPFMQEYFNQPEQTDRDEACLYEMDHSVYIFLYGYKAAMNDEPFNQDLSRLPIYLHLYNEDDLFSGLNLNMVMSWAVEHDLEELMICCLKRGFPVSHPLDAERNTILHLSLIKKWKKVFKFALSLKPEVNQANSKGRTPIFDAVQYDDRAALEALQALGAKTDLQLDSGLNILQLALTKGHYAQVLKILGYPGTEILLPLHDIYYITPLDKACAINEPYFQAQIVLAMTRLGSPFRPNQIFENVIYENKIDEDDQLELLTLCFNKGLSPEHVYGNKTVFRFCADIFDPEYSPYTQMMLLCIEKMSKFDGSDAQGISDLDRLIGLNDSQVIAKAIAQGANFVGVNIFNQTRLQVACMEANYISAAALIRAGLPYTDIFNDEYFGTLCIYLRNCNPEIYRYFALDDERRRLVFTTKGYEAQIEGLAVAIINAGGDLNLRIDPVSGDTLLHLAVRHGWKKVAKLYFDKHADLNVRNDVGDTSLDLARGKPEVEAVLKQKGALSSVDSVHYQYRVAGRAAPPSSPLITPSRCIIS